jgi:hypothetical protein
MSVARTINRSVLCGLAVVLSVLVWGSSCALASSPWWHLTSSARPTSIQPGLAQSEVQELAVSATGGEVFVVGPSPLEAAVRFKWDASDQEAQEAFEEVYGRGNVEVTGGPGDEKATKPYKIAFVGELADKPVELPNAAPSEFFLECVAGSGPDCKKTAVVTEKQQGRVDGQIVVTATNLGDANASGESSPISIIDRLPAGLKATAISGKMIEGAGVGSQSLGPVTCVLGSLTCTFTRVVYAHAEIEITISVVSQDARTGETNEVTATGGNVQSASLKRPISVGGPPSFGVEDYELAFEEEGGALDTQAGSHMFQLTSTLALNQTAEGQPVALTKDLHFKLPAGLIGNATAVAQCTLKNFLSPVPGEATRNLCSAQTAVGVATITAYFPNSELRETYMMPVFNLVPGYGEPARFGFLILQTPIILDTAVRTGEDYGVTVNVNNIVQTAAFVKSEVTFWGTPGDPRHDKQRGWFCLIDNGVNGHGSPFPCNPLEAVHPAALLSLPTSCNGQLQTSVEADSWADPGSFALFGSNEPLLGLDGCNRLPFHPSIGVTPDGQAGSTPTGLTVTEHVPQEVSLTESGLSEANVKDTSVALPAGVVLNPSAADGLQACSEDQVALHEDAPAVCPDASKVATVEIFTPLLPDPVVGAAYLAQQNANPFGSLVALYIVAEDQKAGIIVKAAGEVKADPITGQLVGTFNETPQLPYEDLKLHFFGGDRAPLATPGLCEAYITTASIVPWSGNPPSESSSTFNITTGPSGSSCRNPLPFTPELTAGTTSIQAGGFSPFTMTMSRPDGSQNLTAIKLRMPPGLLGTLATVKLCKEVEANAGTCGPESLIGHTTVSVGVGGDPFTVRGGEVFITEGYGGAPYGLSIVNPAKAGPFDLGKVIVRAKIEVDPISAVLTVTSDATGPYKIPTILDGIPLQIRHVNVSIDRPGFTFNPTNCSPLQIGGSLTSDQGAVQALSVPFQITNCAVLAFKPKLTAKTNGKTSRANGASLSVKLTYPAGPFDANISKVKVDLPKQLPSRLTTLQKACPAKTFEANPAACPSASIVGHAKATTPVLPVGLEGPAYFVSHGGEEFPQLIIVLQGYGTTVHLVGSTFISKAGITSSTFKQVPDVPVGTFELTLPQGKFSALAANGNLCTTKKLAMPTSFVAQNGVVINTSTPIVPTGCAKHAKTKKAKHRSGHKHGKK